MQKNKIIWILIFILGGLFGFGVSNYYYSPTVSNNQIISALNEQNLEVNLDEISDGIRSVLKNFLGDGTSETSEDGNKKISHDEKFEGIYDILNYGYFEKDELELKKMYENAYKGFVEAIGDPYTVYFTSDENSDFHEELKGEKDFEGIGAVVSKKKDGVMIEEPIKGQPAYEAGLMPLDLVLEINGEKTDEMDLQEAVSQIRGKKGTEVELTIFRESEDRIFKVNVMRDKVIVPSVRSKTYTLTGDVNIGYIEISIIGEDTEKAMEEAITSLQESDVKGIILDLRGNGGGFLPIGVQVASHFIQEGETVVSTKYRALEGEDMKSYGYGDLEGLPIVVLVDGLSASASEIISAALRDTIGAKLIGTTTFGKGSIQVINDLSDGSSIKYTVGKWYTPNDINVSEEGLEPDVTAELDLEKYKENKYDSQLEVAKEEVLKEIIGE